MASAEVMSVEYKVNSYYEEDGSSILGENIVITNGVDDAFLKIVGTKHLFDFLSIREFDVVSPLFCHIWIAYFVAEIDSYCAFGHHRTI